MRRNHGPSRWFGSGLVRRFVVVEDSMRVLRRALREGRRDLAARDALPTAQNSLAILLHEEGLLERSIIYATDINPAMLERARANA